MLTYIFVLGLVLAPFRSYAKSDPVFQAYGDSLKSLVSQAKLEEALALLPALDSLAKVYSSPEVEADLFFYKAYYWLFKVGEVKTLALLTEAAVKYNQLGLREKEHLAEAYICVNLYFLGRYEACAEKGLKMLASIPEKEAETIGIVHNILSAHYGGAGAYNDIPKSIDHARQAINIFKKRKDYRRLTSLYGLLVANYNTLEAHGEVLVYIDSAAYFAELLDNKQQVHFLKIRKARSLFKMKRGTDALGLLEEAENYYLEHGSEHGEIIWMYSLRMNYYVGKGEYKKAYELVAVRDSVSRIAQARENEKTTNDLLVKYETEKKEQQIKIQSLVIENEKQRNQRLIFGALGSLSFLLLLFSGAYFYYRQKQQEKLRNTQITYQKQLLETTVETQEQERKRIARDLHDGIGQQMSGLKMGFQQLVENIESAVPKQRGLMTKLNAIIHEAATDVRDLSHQMMPKALQEFGLIPALEDILDKSFPDDQVTYEFEHFGLKGRLPEPIEIGLYRIAQELVNNILKHAKASEVDVQLMQQSDQLLMIVEDNGQGFDATLKNNKGHGRMNIQSRLQAIKGTINYECPDQGGTIVTIRVKV